MISRNILFLCCLLCLFNFYQRHITVEAQNYWCFGYPYNPNTTGSVYRNNLDFVLSTLLSNASLAANEGFYSFSAGSGPNTVYGLFLCRGDLTPDVCAQCVADAGDQLLKLCADQKTAITWLEKCLLHYKNESMSSIVEQNIRIYLYNIQNATDPNRFNQVLGDTMDKIAIQAANSHSGRKFAVQEVNYSLFERIYALGQCTPDLSSVDCNSCLRNCIGDIPLCCSNRLGAVVLTASCNIRFELYPFYNAVTLAPAPAPALNLPPSAPSPAIENINADPLFTYCTDNQYNPSSNTGNIYRTNLKSVLSALSSIASQVTNNGFSNFSAGSDPNTVYGLFLCRGDVSNDVCAQCVANAGDKIVKQCPDQKIAIIWFDECFLRYKNESMFTIAEQNYPIYLRNIQNVTDPDRFNKVLENLMHNITKWAAADPSRKKFAVQSVDYSPFPRKIYALGQCTPDLSNVDCAICLQTAVSSISGCCGRYLFASCNIRCELYQFYNPAYTPPPAPPPNQYPPPGHASSKAIAIAVPVTVVSVVLFIMAFVFRKRGSRKRYDGKAAEIITADSLKYSLSKIKKATNNFSVDNKIGEGGFGSVYKGVLVNGQEIAVKRLSRSSGQGAEEFKNEIMVVAKLQHRNLVRLLGFCLEGEEKILIFEFVPNKSLDYFLFDPEKQHHLNWSTRYNIIGGIARGLLYLHEDSRLRIVHRDLKAGNILLDGNMSPKIADFGMAKICGVDQSEGNTNRIAGTFGYMAPEYTRSGQFSVKSDVFSFGVMILEIITGKKNSSFYQSENRRDLWSYAWQQWRDGTPLALLDPTIGDSYVKTEVLRCIHIGLLCVEENADRRPMMASVVYMLNGSSVSLPTLHLPAVSTHNESENVPEELQSDRSDTKLLPASVNEASFTELYPR